MEAKKINIGELGYCSPVVFVNDYRKLNKLSLTVKKLATFKVVFCWSEIGIRKQKTFYFL